MSLRTRILLFLFIFALLPLMMAVVINLPLVLERVDSFYRQAFLHNLRADFSDLDEHLASRDANVRLLARLPEPSLLSGEKDAIDANARVDLERARYTEWINRILREERDILQIRFLDEEGGTRFWMVRDSVTGSWFASPDKPPALPPKQLVPLLSREIADVVLSPLRVDQQATDPQRTLTLDMMAPIFHDENLRGAVLITVDIGGLVRRDGHTRWVLDDGSYLQLPDMPAAKATAFEEYPGLDAIFAKRRLALWELDERRVIWVPMFVTESGAPLWVGRSVDLRPLEAFRSEMVERVLAIVLGLIVLLLFSARILAKRAEQIGSELIEGIQQTLESDQPVEFRWTDNKELRQLSADLTELSKRHATQTRNLRAHNKELEESNRYKSEFLANVSHELRTPLNSILLLSKLLAAEEAGLNDEQHQRAKVVHKAGQDLKALIDNILDLSRIEAGRFDVHCELIVLQQLVDDVRELLLPQFQQKNLAFEVEWSADAPYSISSDPDRIRQVLKNFLANALKFTEEGSVTLRVAPVDQGSCGVAFHVIDTGIGIAAEKQARIFEAFRQADGSTNRRYGGTGLGLTISQQLAQLLGGEIRVHSEPGKGATFSLLLPLSCSDKVVLEEKPPLIQEKQAEQPHDEPVAADEEQTWAGMRVMLMDHDIKTQLKISQWFNSCDIELVLADDPEEAIESIDDGGPVQWLIINPQLPGLDACATIQAIKTHNDAPLPYIVLQGDDDAANTVDCPGGEAAGSITRPVQREALQSIFSNGVNE